MTKLIAIVKKHPEADSLYVESIDIGEAEPRTVCSGLVKYMSEDEIRGATIIVIVSILSPLYSRLFSGLEPIGFKKGRKEANEITVQLETSNHEGYQIVRHVTLRFGQGG